MLDVVLAATLPWRDWQIWYAAPIIAVISLVYSGTRHEKMSEILLQSYHTAVWLVGFMLILFVVLWLLSTQV